MLCRSRSRGNCDGHHIIRFFLRPFWAAPKPFEQERRRRAALRRGFRTFSVLCHARSRIHSERSGDGEQDSTLMKSGWTELFDGPSRLPRAAAAARRDPRTIPIHEPGSSVDLLGDRRSLAHCAGDDHRFLHTQPARLWDDAVALGRRSHRYAAQHRRKCLFRPLLRQPVRAVFPCDWRHARESRSAHYPQS